MSDLPEGWAQVPLASITEEASQRVPSADERITYIDIGSVDRNSKTIVAPQHLLGADAPSRARKQVRSGDTLVSMTRPNLNAVTLVPPALDGQIASTGFDVLRPLDGIEPRWIAYLVRTEAFVEAMSSLVQGALYPAVRSKDVRAYRVPLAPSTEQTRIADQLDKLLARIQACNERIDAIPALLKRFRQAVLDAATLGGLTSDWRDANCLTFEWEKVCLQDIADVKGGVTKDSKKQSVSDEEVPYLRVANVQRGHIDLHEVKTIRVPREKLKHLLLERGDILFNEGGDLDKLGRGWIWEGQISRCTFQNHVFRARLYNPSNQPKFVSWWGNSRGLEYFLRSGKQTTNLASINKTMLAALPISLPPPEEQAEIVRRVEALFKLADRIEARYMGARAQAKRLTPLMLAKAFRGELVQQDPQDEPTSVVLERIAATKPAKARTSHERPRIQKRPSAIPELDPTDWASLPSGAWAAPADPDGQAAMVWLTAVLRAWGEPMPEREARLAVMLCQQPRLFAAVLPAAQAIQWFRLVGDEARPLPTQVLSFRPAINGHWARAIKSMRARDDLVETGLGDDITWALGSSVASIETAGWPDGRAGFVVAYLRAHGIASVLPLLESSAQEFVDARAA
jgi:type I restriction enzyme, S subunit